MPMTASVAPCITAICSDDKTWYSSTTAVNTGTRKQTSRCLMENGGTAYTFDSGGPSLECADGLERVNHPRIRPQ